MCLLGLLGTCCACWGCRGWHGDQCVFALDHAAGDVVGDGLDDHGRVVGLGEHDPAITGVLHKAIHALIASHQHMRDDVDPQPRGFALADAAVEQIDIVGHLREQGIERLVEDFQPCDFRIAQIDHHAVAVGRLDPRLAQRIP